jgi:hypothetical protein
MMCTTVRSMVSHAAMKEVAETTLKSAIKEIDELGNLFIEDQFRHIVVSELNKKTTIRGNFKPGDSYPKIVLEFMWKKGGKKMDIAILGSSTKGKSDRYSYAKTNPQPLAIELKVSKDKKDIAKDVVRVKRFLLPGGKSTFKNGMVLVGSKTAYRPSAATISSTQTGFLFGCISDDNKPFILWLKRPKPPKKQIKKRNARKKSTSTVYNCQAKRKSNEQICRENCGGNRTKYCYYHKDAKNRKR